MRRKYSSYHIDEILKQDANLARESDDDDEPDHDDEDDSTDHMNDETVSSASTHNKSTLFMQPLSVDVTNSTRIHSIASAAGAAAVANASLSMSSSNSSSSSSVPTSPQQQFYYSYYYQALLAHYQGSNRSD